MEEEFIMKSFLILLTLLFVLLGFFASIGLVYYVNNSVKAEAVEAEPPEEKK